jgi:hypothetical protein
VTRVRRQLGVMRNEVCVVVDVLYRIWRYKRAGYSLNMRDDL